MSGGPKVSLGRSLGNGAGWCSLLLVLFFISLPLLGRPMLRCIAAVLGALNNFGSGY